MAAVAFCLLTDFHSHLAASVVSLDWPGLLPRNPSATASSSEPFPRAEADEPGSEILSAREAGCTGVWAAFAAVSLVSGSWSLSVSCAGEALSLDEAAVEFVLDKFLPAAFAAGASDAAEFEAAAGVGAVLAAPLPASGVAGVAPAVLLADVVCGAAVGTAG